MSRIEDLLNYGASIQKDNELDINTALFQVSNSFYGTQNKIDLSSYENQPNTLITLELLRYFVVDWFAYRNTRIQPVSISGKEKRMITSQGLIEIQQKSNILSVFIKYINLIDLQKQQLENEIVI